jgi:hypothetical protein
MAVYRTKNLRPISKITPELKLDNQVVLTGTDQDYLVSNGIFFLESSGGFTNDHDPLRCDYGIQLTGTVRMAKGYYLTDILI